MGNADDSDRKALDSLLERAQASHMRHKAFMQEVIQNTEKIQRAIQYADNVMDELDRVVPRTSAHIDELLRQEGERIQAYYRKLKALAIGLTAAGLVAGIGLLAGASQVQGFGKTLMDSLGTAFFGAATVGVGAYVVARYWNAGETNNRVLLQMLKLINDRLIVVSVSANADQEILRRLDYFLAQQGLNPALWKMDDSDGSAASASLM